MCHFEGRRKEPFARRLPIRAVEEHIVVEILEVLQVGAGQLRGRGEHIGMGHHTSGNSLRWMQGWFRNLLRSSQIAGSCQGWPECTQSVLRTKVMRALDPFSAEISLFNAGGWLRPPADWGWGKRRRRPPGESN